MTNIETEKLEEIIKAITKKGKEEVPSIKAVELNGYIHLYLITLLLTQMDYREVIHRING